MGVRFKIKFENVLFRTWHGYFYHGLYTSWQIWNLKKKKMYTAINMRPKTANSAGF